MADSSPLLIRSDSVDSLEKQTHGITVNEIIERCIGDFNKTQFLQALLVSAAWIFDAQQTFISVFTDREPSWHCTESNRTASSCTNSVPNQYCNLPEASWAWDEPARTSTVSEWNLACLSSIVSGLPASSFFVGCLFGGLVLATLADSLGRKNMLLLSCLVMALTSTLTVLSPNVWVYSALRFVAGFGRATIGTCALVLSTEVVGKKWRGQVGILGFFCFTIGFLSLPAIGFLNKGRSWRDLYLLTSIPTLIYCVLVYFIVQESPRWLWVRGRKEEAMKTLKILSKQSSTNLSTFFSVLPIQDEDEEGEENPSLYAALKMLWEKKWAFRRLATVMIVGFGIGMLYYGMPLGVGNLGVNLYLSVALNALSELPSSLITFFLIGRMKRRSSLLGFTLASGVTSFLIIFNFDGQKLGFMKEMKVVLELISFFSACTGFNVVLIYSLELFPTRVRNSAVAMVRQALVLGGVFCPMIVAAGRSQEGLSYAVFGLVIGFCGLFAFLLPDTDGGTFCDTMDEQEHKDELVKEPS